MAADRMAETRLTNPLVEQFQRGGAPRDLRLLAAQGALPLKTEDVVDLLHYLLGDLDAEIAETAGTTLKAIPTDQMLPVLQATDTPPAVLAWAVRHRDEPRLREEGLQN